LDRLFRIDFYPHEWLSKTGRLTLEQRGMYIQIVSLIYAHMGPIDNDPAWIGRAAGCSTRMAKTLISQLEQAGKIYFQGSKISQKRCENELNLKRNLSENGAKGARKKYENHHEFNNNNDICSGPSSGQKENWPDSPSPSPSPNEKYIKGFAGKTIRLVEADFLNWKKLYNAIPDLTATLSALDDYYTQENAKDWFVRCSGALAKKHQEYLIKNPKPPQKRQRVDVTELNLQAARA
jgi:uncharacterized protein YdaU (DUF1376 family)